MTVNVKSNGRSYNLLDNTNIKFDYLGTLSNNNQYISINIDYYNLFIFLMGFSDTGYGAEKIFSTTIQTAKNLKNIETLPSTASYPNAKPHIYIDYISQDLKIHYYMEIIKIYAPSNNDIGLKLVRNSYSKSTCQVYGLKF